MATYSLELYKDENGNVTIENKGLSQKYSTKWLTLPHWTSKAGHSRNLEDSLKNHGAGFKNFIYKQTHLWTV